MKSEGNERFSDGSSDIISSNKPPDSKSSKKGTLNRTGCFQTFSKLRNFFELICFLWSDCIWGELIEKKKLIPSNFECKFILETRRGSKR
jgi:hypothetical protein